MAPKFGENGWAECLNTKLILPTLVNSVYSVKLKKRNFKLLNSGYVLYLTTIGVAASRGAVARNVTVKLTGCVFDPRSRRWHIYLNLHFHFFALVSRLSAALSSATQHAISPELGKQWGTECFITRFPLTILLCTGNSVKLIILTIDVVFSTHRETGEVNWAQLNSKELILTESFQIKI